MNFDKGRYRVGAAEVSVLNDLVQTCVVVLRSLGVTRDHEI